MSNNVLTNNSKQNNSKIKQALRAVIVISLMTVGSTACTTTKIITVPVKLPLPVQPLRPKYTEAEKTSISESLWLKIVERDDLCRHYAEDAIAIITGNNKRADQQ